MLSHNGLVKVLWSREIWREPSNLRGYVRDDTHSVGSETGAMTPWVTMSFRLHTSCSWYLIGTFLWGCWIGDTEGSVLMVYVPGMFPMVLNKPGKACFRATMSQATTVGRIVASAGLGLWALRADLDQSSLGRDGVYGLESLVSLKAGLGRVLLRKDGMWGLDLLMGLLNWTIFMVILLPWGE